MKKLTMIPTLLLVANMLAASDGTVSLSPAVITLRGEAGQSTTQTLVLRNSTTRSLTFEPIAHDVVVRNGRREFVQAGGIAPSIAATAVFSESIVTIASGEKAAVTVTLTIPANATHRAVIALFRGRDSIVRNGVATTSSLGTLLTFALSADVTLTAGALVVQPQTPTSNLSIVQTCTNAGNEPLVTKGMLAVIDSEGRLAGKAAVAPHRLLPGERARLGTEYAAELPRGHYRLVLTYEYEGKALTQSAEMDVQ